MEAKSKQKKAKPDNAIALKQFSSTEQAIIVLAANNKNQSISEFMGDCIRKQIQTTIKIIFAGDPEQQAT